MTGFAFSEREYNDPFRNGAAGYDPAVMSELSRRAQTAGDPFSGQAAYILRQVGYYSPQNTRHTPDYGQWAQINNRPLWRQQAQQAPTPAPAPAPQPTPQPQQPAPPAPNQGGQRVDPNAPGSGNPAQPYAPGESDRNMYLASSAANRRAALLNALGINANNRYNPFRQFQASRMPGVAEAYYLTQGISPDGIPKDNYGQMINAFVQTLANPGFFGQMRSAADTGLAGAGSFLSNVDPATVMEYLQAFNKLRNLGAHDLVSQSRENTLEDVFTDYSTDLDLFLQGRGEEPSGAYDYFTRNSRAKQLGFPTVR